MHIELKPEQQKTIERAVQSGLYHSQEEVMDRALELIGYELETGDWMDMNAKEIGALLEERYAQAERGELIDGNAVREILRQSRADRLTG